MTCPSCGTTMEFNRNQGPFGGYKCPSCGLQIDKKTSKWVKITIANKRS